MSDVINNRWNWNFGISCNDMMTKDKNSLIESYLNYMFIRCQMIFKSNGLPDTIPYRELERILQRDGKVILVKNNEGKWFASWFAYGGDLNEYYIPKDRIVTNPHIKGLKADGVYHEGDDDNVVIWNDSNMFGLVPMFRKYAELLAETDISLRFADVNSRLDFILTADNDQAYQDAKDLLDSVEEGGRLKPIMTKASLDGLFAGMKAEQTSSTSKVGKIKELIELSQYLKAQWFLDVGLNANYNMKREAINASESGMNDDILLPLTDDMLVCRIEGFKEFERVSGIKVDIELNSAWKDIHANYHASQDGIETPEKGEDDVPVSEKNEDQGNE